MLSVSHSLYHDEYYCHSNIPFWMMFEIILLVKVEVIADLEAFIKHIDE